MIEFTVPGEPVGQGNLNAAMRGGKIRQFHRNAEDIENYRSAVRTAAVTAAPDEIPIEVGPVYLEAEFVVKRPKGHYGTGRNEGVLKASAPTYHTGERKDADKLLRALGDALTDCVLRDDGQIAAAYIEKRYVREGEAPHTRVTIDSLAGQEETSGG